MQQDLLQRMMRERHDAREVNVDHREPLSQRHFMKESGGKMNPGLVNKVLKERLEARKK